MNENALQLEFFAKALAVTLLPVFLAFSNSLPFLLWHVIGVLVFGISLGLCDFFSPSKWVFRRWEAESFGANVYTGGVSWIEVPLGDAQATYLTSDLTTKYTAAVYWAITTMSTVGYGDISPQTNIERLSRSFHSKDDGNGTECLRWP